jgi:hypothetical protein
LRRHLDLCDSPRIIESLIRACRELGNHARAETIFSHAFFARRNLEGRRRALWPTEKCVEELKGVWRERLEKGEAEERMKQLDMRLDEHAIKLKEQGKQTAQQTHCQ